MKTVDPLKETCRKATKEASCFKMLNSLKQIMKTLVTALVTIKFIKALWMTLDSF